MILSLALARGQSPAVRSERGAALAPGSLDVDDSGLEWVVADVMMRHCVQDQRPKLGHVERHLGGESPDLRGNLGKGARGMAGSNSWTGSSGLYLLSFVAAR